MLLALGLFVVSMLCFALSTRQMQIWLRALAWLLGAGSLAGSAFVTSGNDHFGLWAVLQNALGGGRGSFFVRAWEGNWPAVEGGLGPTLDIGYIFAGMLGLLALLAFTPGECLERCLRPALAGLFGAVLGAFIALSLVATGFAGYVRPQVYFAVPEPSGIVDGDTFKIDDVSIRLFGYDAVEEDQICFGVAAASCSSKAREKLVSLIKGRLVLCETRRGRQDSHGRALATCEIQTADGERRDLSSLLLSAKVGVAYTGKKLAERPRSFSQFELGCTLRPWLWRHDEAKKNLFKSAKDITQLRRADFNSDFDLIGDCSDMAP